MSVDESLKWHTHVFCQICTRGVVLHHTAASVVLAVPHNLVRCSLVQAQAERRFVLPHLTCHVVTAAKLVCEALAIGIKDNAANTTKGLCSQELDLGIWIIRLDQTSWVYLHPLKINTIGATSLTHLDGISSAVLTVGGGQVEEVWAVLRQQGV